MTYILSIGFILVTGCGWDGADITVIRNLTFSGYKTLESCQSAGNKTQRGYKCRKETE